MPDLNDASPIRLGEWATPCTRKQRDLHERGMALLRVTFTELLLASARLRDVAGYPGDVNEDGELIRGGTLNRLHSVAEGAFDAAKALDAAVGLEWAVEERRRMGFGATYVRDFVRPPEDDVTSVPAGP